MEEKTYNKTGATIKFVLCSLFGLFMFFVKIPFQGTTKLPIDIVTSTVQNLLDGYYTEVLLVCTVLFLVDFFRKKSWQNTTMTDKVLIGFNFLGAVMILMMKFHIGPEFMFADDIIPAAVLNMGKAFVMVYLVTFFMPFLLDFGLVDFFGVITRPLMRKVFKLPGRTAIVAVGAFLGNYAIGHIQSNEMYTTGRLTLREASVVDIGLCTTSIGLLLTFASSNGMMDHWGLVFFATAVAVYLTTAILVRVPPLSVIPDTYCEGVTPAPEEEFKGNIFKEAWECGVDVAGKAMNPLQAVWTSGKKSLIMIATVHVSAVSMWVVPAIINKYTPIFYWIGCLFKPLLTVLGMPNASELANAIGICFVNPMSATYGLGALDLAPAAKFFAATFAAPIIIFFGAFLASIYSTKVRIKFSHFVFVWFERAFVVTIILSLLSKLFFM